MELTKKIIELQNTGSTDEQIIQQLQNEGNSPKEIYDSLNQVQVKNAISPPPMNVQDQTPQNALEEMQEYPPANFNQNQTPEIENTQEQPTQKIQAPPTPEQPPMQEYAQQQEDYYNQTPQAYSQDQNYPYQQEYTSTETISEIAEQVVLEKFEDFEEKMSDLTNFKDLIESRVDDLNERLKKIEHSISTLNSAVIGKVGEVSQNNALIHKDIDNLHGTVSKLMNPLIDNLNALEKKNQ
jgi:DNA-binding transcriptional MerR regulator